MPFMVSAQNFMDNKILFEEKTYAEKSKVMIYEYIPSRTITNHNLIIRLFF